VRHERAAFPAHGRGGRSPDGEVAPVTGPSVLLGLTGLGIDGGIAAVSRCITRALDAETRGGRLGPVDRVLLLDEAARPPPAPPATDQRLSGGSQARFVWQLWRSFRHRRPDLVLFDLVGLARSVILPLPGFPPPRYAIFAHGIELDAAREGARAAALEHASVILTNSEFTADRVRREHPALQDRVRPVVLCIDPDRVAAWEESAPAAEPTREPAAVIVGRMSSEERGKGHDELIACWPEVVRAHPDAQLWVVGGGDDVPRLEARARASGAGDAVRFLGRLPDDELADVYRRASIFAMPSRQEGFGLTYAEAMWFGLPCIGSTADAAGQVISDGETGLLVPYGETAPLARALVDLLGNRERLSALGEAARLRARERFSFPRFRVDLLAALEIG
jgi:phosphatidylinositol alpha-1,6-mannosyltransferase